MITAKPRKQSEIIEFLKSTSSYPEGPKKIEVKETHISIVFLTDHFAYKLKKPVRFDFLDFSTPELRRQACEDELNLNRRLASGIYQAVVPLSVEDGHLVLGGQGEPVDWLVKMKRLNDSETLESLLGNKQLADSQTEAIAERLASFFSNLSPMTTKSCEFRRELAAHIDANRSDLIGKALAHLERIQFIHSAQMRFLNVMSETFDARVCDGRVVDGHGDLKPEHIYFSPNPIIIDCVEFNPKYRQNDVIDELSFLAMECDRLDAPAVGSRIIDAYSRASNDFPETELVAFYKSYRACVRAKVAAMRADQTVGKEQSRFLRKLDSYLEFANRYASELGPKMVISVGGLMGTGKSTLVKAISKQLNANFLQTDVIRHEIFPRNGQSCGFDEAKYSPKNRDVVYDEMFKKLPTLLKTSPTVVLDGTFGKESQRQEVKNKAKELDSQWLHLECVCPAQLSIERVKDRLTTGRSNSEARSEFYERQAAGYESPIKAANILTIDTSQSIIEQVAEVISFLRCQLEKTSRLPVADPATNN